MPSVKPSTANPESSGLDGVSSTSMSCDADADDADAATPRAPIATAASAARRASACAPRVIAITPIVPARAHSRSGATLPPDGADAKMRRVEHDAIAAAAARLAAGIPKRPLASL